MSLVSYLLHGKTTKKNGTQLQFSGKAECHRHESHGAGTSSAKKGSTSVDCCVNGKSYEKFTETKESDVWKEALEGHIFAWTTVMCLMMADWC